MISVIKHVGTKKIGLGLGRLEVRIRDTAYHDVACSKMFIGKHSSGSSRNEWV